GVFGAWSALRLARAGWRVTLVDAYGPANGRASSSDHSRVIRAGYGADAIYTRWATESLAGWHWLARRAGEPLVVECGALFLAEAGSAHLAETARTLREAGVTHERLDAAAVASRYPQLGVIGLGEAVFEARGGVLRARRAVAAAVAAAVAGGAVYRTGRVAALDESMAAPRLQLQDGASLDADHYVFACGPWLPAVFPQAVGPRIRPTRQEVLHFGVPAGDRRFGADRMPAWIDFAAGVYGIPDLDAHGFKVGIDRHGAAIDPDTADRLVGDDAVQMTRAFFARRFPALMHAPLVDAHVCQYENTATGDFIVDRHPRWGNVWIAGGGSGHGFKHGPAVGKHVADLVAGRAGVEPRFALAGQAVAAARTVY
ncbi:MAG TPA: FAD-dependent oxidoreductase, partial [Vicinamibacterales bacterium]|nr:FAD-dependent oxidoreductase [Vicinamibacterales bacterium]